MSIDDYMNKPIENKTATELILSLTRMKSIIEHCSEDYDVERMAGLIERARGAYFAHVEQLRSIGFHRIACAYEQDFKKLGG